MATDPQRLDVELMDDLTMLGDRLVDAEFCRDLYRTLTNARWTKDGFDGHVSLSWTHVAEVIDALRQANGREPMTLAQSGGEGEPAAAAVQALADLGWTRRPLDTGTHDDAHIESAPDPPPPDA